MQRSQTYRDVASNMPPRHWYHTPKKLFPLFRNPLPLSMTSPWKMQGGKNILCWCVCSFSSCLFLFDLPNSFPETMLAGNWYTQRFFNPKATWYSAVKVWRNTKSVYHKRHTQMYANAPGTRPRLNDAVRTAERNEMKNLSQCVPSVRVCVCV